LVGKHRQDGAGGNKLDRGPATIREREAFSELRQVEDWSPELQKSKAYEQILLDIILGELPPSARLDEQGLARRYKVGLAGVRDALGRLSLEGLVQRRPRMGTTVAPLDLQEVQEAFEVRRQLEPLGAALAAKNATDAEIARILTAYDGAEERALGCEFRSLVAIDQNFHRAIAVASHNLTLARMIVTLQNKAARHWCHLLGMLSEQDRVEDILEHRAVASAIADRDEERAHAAMLRVLGDFPAARRDNVGARRPDLQSAVRAPSSRA
jgi:DNA-binding GntR family transcriptional regulator